MAGAVEVLPYTANDGRRRERAVRVRLQVIRNASEESIGAFVRANVEPGSRLRTDGCVAILIRRLLDTSTG